MTTFQRTHLAVFIDVIFEVIVFSNDSFGDERLVEDTNCGQQGGAVGLSQPRDLSGLLVVLVVQVQASLHGHNLSISLSDECEGIGQKVAALLLKNLSISAIKSPYFLILVMMRLPQLMKVTISPSENVSASAPSTNTLGPYQTSFMPTSAFWMDAGFLMGHDLKFPY